MPKYIMEIFSRDEGISIRSIRHRMRNYFRDILWDVGFKVAPFALNWLSTLSRETLHTIGRTIGSLWYTMVSSSRTLGLDNLDLVYGTSVSRKEKTSFCRESFKSILVCMLDYYHFSFHTESIMDLVTMDRATEEKMQALVEGGQGVLVFSSHLGNWEMLAAYFGRFITANLLARPQEQFVHFVADCRNRYHVSTLSDSTIITMKKILQKLKKGEFIGFILDRNIKNASGMMIDFMGHPAFTPYFPVKLALKSGAPVVGMFMIPEGKGYRLYIEDPIHVTLMEDLETTYRYYTDLFLKVIEKYIRMYPEHWFWAHKRWGRPKGVVAFE